MKLSELTLLLNERIYSDNGNLVITIQKQQEASDAEQISTFIRRQPLETKLRDHDGTKIYSIYNYKSSAESKNLLSSIKGKGPYKLNTKQLDFFLERTADAAGPVTDRHKPDVIIYPKSSSSLTAEFVAKLHHRYPKALIVHEAFIKKILKAGDVEALINTDHPDWDNFKEKFPERARSLKVSLKKKITDNGTLELKSLYKPYLKFIKNFIEMRDAYEVLENVLEKNVLVVDDVLSSGATMIEMIRQVAEYEPKTIFGLTIFKNHQA